ncbi:universal stress protein [Calidifontibacillus oryziterrae]|uniref:universal stress protein n=1 Tax=Calidifontibacillus oryziterrae TaxID=1191699 RepID=UPI0002E4A3A6|nr:universal stress protein [Calidifontibacillus oryziterrae]
MMFSKILVAYDGSELSKKALKMAIAFAKEDPNLFIEVVHVYQFPTVAVGEGMFTPPPSVAMEYYNHAEEIVAEAKQELEKTTTNCNVVLKEGSFAKNILDHAKETGCELILIGSRGLGGIKEYFLGSVSHQVVQHSKIPVLIVK